MVVTKIEAVAKNKYKVYLDERFAFVLYKGELSRYRVTVNEELSVEMYEKIRREVILKRGKLRALHLLNVMGRTEEQLRQKLRLGSYPEDIIDTLKENYKVYTVNATEEAKKLGNSRVFNLIVLGIAAQHMEFSLDEWYDVIEKTVPSKTIDINRQAFDVGYQL